MKYLPLGFSGMGSTMNCQAEYTHPCKHAHVFMQELIVDMKKKFICACFEKQLYDVTIQVCWNQPGKFQNIVVHPAVFACIGTLMKCSALEFYVIAVSG